MLYRSGGKEGELPGKDRNKFWLGSEVDGKVTGRVQYKMYLLYK